jgi:predicted nucleic acid-binding protein
VDTNVLVYATVAEAPGHEQARNALHDASDRSAPLWISRQVLREYLAALTRPQTFTPALPLAALLPTLEAWQNQMHVADETAAVTRNLVALLQLVPVGGKQVHDANIVATMQAVGVTRLLTANPGDFARFAHLITVIPL